MRSLPEQGCLTTSLPGTEEHRLPDERIEAVVKGVVTQAIVAFSDRLLVVKVGPTAGATGGGRATTFRYLDIVGVQENTGIMMGVIIIQTAGMNTVSGDYWAIHGIGQAHRNDDAFKLPNTLPVNKILLKEYAADIHRIEELIRQAQAPTPSPVQPQAPPTATLGSQLAELMKLHDAGGLTDEEFALAKRSLLPGGSGGDQAPG